MQIRRPRVRVVVRVPEAVSLAVRKLGSDRRHPRFARIFQLLRTPPFIPSLACIHPWEPRLQRERGGGGREREQSAVRTPLIIAMNCWWRRAVLCIYVPTGLRTHCLWGMVSIILFSVSRAREPLSASPPRVSTLPSCEIRDEQADALLRRIHPRNLRDCRPSTLTHPPKRVHFRLAITRPEKSCPDWERARLGTTVLRGNRVPRTCREQTAVTCSF